MAELFSNAWAEQYMTAWNSDPEITDTLARVGFNSVVGFGYVDDDEPAFVMTIQDGKVVSTAHKDEGELKWDLRATPDNWTSLIAKPPGLMKLGIAYTSRKLRFKKGDYATMIKDPSLASAFVKSFGLMSLIN